MNPDSSGAAGANGAAPRGAAATGDDRGGPRWIVWGLVAALVYLLLVGVAMIGAGFKWVSGGADGAAAIFAFARNPIVGVILGTLATALVQSSSTVTSVIVGLVAGGVPVSIAVPMIMGANMGTTITNTIVSLGNLREPGAFRKSFEAATVHDFFNLYSILVFLPLEVLFHPLERSAERLAGAFTGDASASLGDFHAVAAVTQPLADSLTALLTPLGTTAGALLTIVVGISCVIASVLYLGRLLRSVMTGRARSIVDVAIGRGPISGIASGTVVTVLVQSSSTTTSLVVPLAGAGVLTTAQVYPFTLGANIGTRVTAPPAPTPIPGPCLSFGSGRCAPAGGLAVSSSAIAPGPSATSGQCSSSCRDWYSGWRCSSPARHRRWRTATWQRPPAPTSASRRSTCASSRA